MTSEAAHAGSRIYTKSTLSIYDIYVLRFSGRFAWQCSAPLVVDFYNRYISANHLEVGVGTGYFLDKCRFPSYTSPLLALVDLNPNRLQGAAKRLSRYSPLAYQANALEPLSIGATGFDSAGLSYLLHSLPGSMLRKGIVFKNLKSLINKDGVVFGTTILGQGVKHNFLA